jgi:carbamoyl-phosphate synthase large subunit
MLNILFTSVGRRVELLRTFRKAYAALGLAGKIVATDIDPLAPAISVADDFYIVPRVDSNDFVPTIANLCFSQNIHVVFPLIDPDIPVLAKNRKQIEQIGARLAVVDPSAAEVTADKWQTVQFFRSLGLATPESWLPGELKSNLDFPVFIKPRRGSAAANTFRVRNADELQFFSRYIEDPIVQEFIDGPEISTDVVCDLKSDVLAIVSRQRLQVRSGEVAKGVTIHHKRITAACQKIAKALPAVGPITVQCMMKDDVPHFIEINARLGGGFPLGVAAGAESPKLLLSRLAGLPVQVPPVDSYDAGVFMTRFDDSFFLSSSERDRMAVKTQKCMNRVPEEVYSIN